ncbi:hypothetical protein BN1058_00115 [Paraliobacillus sp. PM-2]|nr:hypothetical protein BN1058_00115 [Paraliobacillus sp. PM-2]
MREYLRQWRQKPENKAKIRKYQKRYQKSANGLEKQKQAEERFYQRKAEEEE